MNFLERITPVVLTWNEEPNIKRTFDQLRWAREVVVVDSGSTDGTLRALTSYRNASVVTRPFTSHAEQWGFAVQQTRVEAEWILALDADFVLTEQFRHEMANLQPPDDVGGYQARFVYWSLGKPLRGTLYPPKVVLFRRNQGRFSQEGHTQRLSVTGRCLTLRAPIHHDDRKSLPRWLTSQAQYARLEAERICCQPRKDVIDRLRLAGLGAPAAAGYALLVKGVMLDGKPGLYYATQRAIAEALLSLELWGRP